MKMRILLAILSTLLSATALGADFPTAREWNRQVAAGWNLGNQLESCPWTWENETLALGNPDYADDAETGWGNPKVTKEMIDAVRAAGFNAVRIPVRWQCHIVNAETMTVSPTWMKRVKEVVDYCIDNDMLVIINTHHDKWIESCATNAYREQTCRRLTLLWTQIAQAFADYDYRLAFAGTNEVHLPDNWSAPTAENQNVQNAYNQAFVDAVRATGGNNLKRHLIVQTYACNHSYGLSGLVIPTDTYGNGNDYMSVEFHYYVPYEYCNSTQYYYWGEPYKQYGVPSSGNETAMKTAFNAIQRQWGQKGLGVVIGEWGVSDHWDKATNQQRIHDCMTYYCKTLVSEARDRGFSTFVWDNNVFGNGTEKFGIFDRNNQMNIRAKWILDGIFQAIPASVPSVYSTSIPTISRPYFHQGRIVIRKGNVVYNLRGGVEKIID